MQLDVIQYAKQVRSINKSISAKQITKLECLVGGDAGELDVNLQFFMSDHGLPAVTGTVGGSLGLICQRCMSPVTYVLNLELRLLLLSPDQKMPEMDLNLEPYIYDSATVTLVDLISDDVVLSLPQVVKHSGEVCGSVTLKSVKKGNEKVLEEERVSSSSTRENPFSGLKSLLGE